MVVYAVPVPRSGASIGNERRAVAIRGTLEVHIVSLFIPLGYQRDVLGRRSPHSEMHPTLRLSFRTDR